MSRPTRMKQVVASASFSYWKCSEQLPGVTVAKGKQLRSRIAQTKVPRRKERTHSDRKVSIYQNKIKVGLVYRLHRPEQYHTIEGLELSILIEFHGLYERIELHDLPIQTPNGTLRKISNPVFCTKFLSIITTPWEIVYFLVNFHFHGEFPEKKIAEPISFLFCTNSIHSIVTLSEQI